MRMKKNLLMMATALGLSSVFNPKLPSLKTGSAKSKRLIVNNPYNRAGYARRRDITPLTEMKNRKHMPHQGKKECARRVRQMAARKLKAEATSS